MQHFVHLKCFFKKKRKLLIVRKKEVNIVKGCVKF